MCSEATVSATQVIDTASPEPNEEPSDSSTSKTLSEAGKRLDFEVELDNCVKRGDFTPVEAKSVPRDSNIIGSHCIFNRKLDSTDKARIVPCGRRDKDKDFIRVNAPCMSLEGFRTVLSTSADRKWHVALMNMITAFQQAPGFDREIYVCPPLEANATGSLCKLNSAAYGLTDSDQLW